MPKVLSFDNKDKKCAFYFVLCSLNRTFALAIGSSPHQIWAGVVTELRWEWGENPRHYPML